MYLTHKDSERPDELFHDLPQPFTLARVPYICHIITTKPAPGMSSPICNVNTSGSIQTTINIGVKTIATIDLSGWQVPSSFNLFFEFITQLKEAQKKIVSRWSMQVKITMATAAIIVVGNTLSSKHNHVGVKDGDRVPIRQPLQLCLLEECYFWCL